MTKRFSFKKFAITLLSALFVLCASFGIASANNAKNANADGTVAFQMLDGADLRLDVEHNGLRFAATVPSDYDSSHKYKMLFVPLDMLDFELLATYNNDYVAYFNEVYPGQILAEAPLIPMVWYDEDFSVYKKGESYLLGAITDIKYENLNREFFAIAYRTVNGVREYATYNEGENVRSVFYIASAYAGVYDSIDKDAASIVDNFVISAINQKAEKPEENRLDALTYNLTLAGNDYMGTDSPATYKVEGNVSGVDIADLNAIITYSVIGDGASISADGVLTAKKAGAITVKANVLGQELTKTVTVEKVIKEVTIEMGNYVLNTKDVEGIDFVIEGIEGAPISVSMAKSSAVEFDVATLTYDAVAQTLTIPYAAVKEYYGPNTTTFTITTDSAIYTVKVVFVTLAISDASQINAGNASTLNQMQRLGGATGNNYETNAPIYHGYYVLSNDIDFGGQEILHSTSLWGASKGAVIQLDGKGYSFKNFKVGNSIFFDTLAQDNGAFSSISNVGFIGEVTGGYGLFGYYMSAKFVNCYFDITVAEGKTNAIASFYGSWMHGMTGCTFILRGAAGQNVSLASPGNWTTDGGNFNGSIVFIDEVENGIMSGAELNAPTAGSSCKVTGATVYDYSDNLIALTVLVGNDAVVELAGATKVLKDGKNITENVEITETGVVIPASEISDGASYVVFAGDSSKVVIIDVVKESIVENGVVAYASKTDDSGNIVSNDFTYAVDGEVTSVKIGDTSVLYTFENGVVTIASDTLKANVGSDKVITISTAAKDYVINATIATFGITKYSDLVSPNVGTTTSAWRRAGGATGGNPNAATYRSSGYIVLVNDVYGDGTDMREYGHYAAGNYAYGFTGIFDGCGNTIYNATSSSSSGWFGPFGKFEGGAQMKNLKVINMTTSGSYWEGFFGGESHARLDNVYFDVTFGHTSGIGMLGRNHYAAITNSTFILRTADSKIAGAFGNGSSASNSVVFVDGTPTTISGLAVYGLTENTIAVNFTSGSDATVDLAGVVRVLKTGVDITANVVINESSVVIPSALVSETDIYVIVGASAAKLVNFAIQRAEHSETLGYSKRTVEATAAADFSYEVNGTVSYATIDGSAVEYAEDNGVVTIESIKALSSGSTARKLVIATETDIYHIALTVADYVITSAEDYASMNWQKALGRVTGATYGSGLKAVVLSDLDFGGATVSFGTAPNEWNSTTAGFIGSLDFNGYAIHNLTFASNLLGDNLGASATISNLRLYDYTCTNVITTWYHNAVKYGWYIEGTNTKLNKDPLNGGTAYRNFFRNGIILNTNEAEGVEEINMTSAPDGGGRCGNLNVQNGYAANTIQGYPNSYMIGNGKFLPADSWGQDETRCGTYKYTSNLVSVLANKHTATVELGFTPTAVYKDGAKLDIALSSTITIENADENATYLAVGSNAVKVIRITLPEPIFEITFNGNGATSGSMQPVSAKVGQNITLPENTFVKSGYTFIGWSLTENGSVDYENNSTFTKEEGQYNLYAVWSVNENTIIFNGNGATIGLMESVKAKTGQTITLPKNTFERENYIFKGWSTAPNGSVEYSDGSNFIMGTDSQYTLYAIWQKESYTINFNGNGADSGAMQSISVSASEKIDLPLNIFVKEGYYFAGWSENANGGILLEDGANYTMPSREITLYAYWVVNEIDETTASAELMISNSYRKVSKFDKLQVAIYTSLQSATVSWISSNSSVAEVSSIFVDDTGLYVANIVCLNTGDATITAIVNGRTISCDLEILESDYYPYVSFSTIYNEIEIVSGSTFDISAVAQINGIDLNVDLTWYSLDYSIAYYSNGKIFAKNAGQTSIGCQFEYNGEIIFKEINVIVKSLTYVEFNELKVNLVANSSDGETQFTLKPINIYIDNVAIGISSISNVIYEVADSNVIEISQSNNNVIITAKGRGETILYAKIILNDGTEIKSFVVVVVAAKVVELDLGAYGLNTATASKIPFTQQVEGTKILSATFAGVKIGLDAITFENGIVTIPYEIVSKLYGKNRTATISTDVADYYYTLDVVTCLITSVNQIHTGSTSVLPQYAIAGGATAYDNKSNNGKDASANNIYGYFVLGADIDFGGISIVHAQTNWDAGTGFAGTLDGRGYTISNFTLNGHNALFGGMSSSAVISNLNIVDFSVYQGGLFGWYFNGSYDNLFIKSNADSTDYILGHKPSGANVFTNCVVVSQGSVSFSLDGEMNETFGSVFYVEDPSIVGVELKSTCKVESISIVKEVNANEDVVLEISGVNRIIYRGVDVSNQEGIILDSDTITFSAEYISTHRSTFTLDMGKFNRYFLAKLESEEIVVNNVIAAASRTNDENQVIETDFVYEIDGAVESVTISGNAVSYSVSDGYLYISSSVLKENVGKHVITIKTNAYTYVLNTTIATFVATKFSDISSCLNASGTLAPAMIALGATSASFKESAANAKGYIVLANDIDAQGQIFNFGFYGYNSLGGNGSNPYYGFNGTFDGNGKSIYNFVTGSGGWQTVFGMSTSTREFKDLTLIGSVPSGQYFEGLFGYMVSGNLNNVYIDIELGSACTYGIFGRMTGGFNVTDSTIIVREGTKALSGAALSQQIASATNGALWNKGTTFNSTIVLTDYAFTTALKSKVGAENIYSITDNQIEAGCTLDGEVFVELSGITKIFKNGKNITSKTIVSENGAILTFDEVQKGEELVVIGSGFAKIVKVANTAAYVSANFNGNGATGGSVEKITVKTGDSITLPENTFERVGYTFVGWSLTMSGEEILNVGDSIVLGQTNSTIYAIWTANENTINFNGNGADSGSMQSIVARTNENIILPANAFTKQWHGFIGWSSTANGEVEYADKSIYVVGVESEITLYAVWEFLLVEKEINIGNYGLNTATETSRNLIIQGIEQQPLSFVFSYKNETKAVSYTYDSVAKTITIPYSEIRTFIGPNAFQIEMYTDSVVYIVNGVLATLEISQASQINTGSTSSLNQMQQLGGTTGTSSSGLNYSGYYYLSNDIDFGGSTISHAREYYRWSLLGTYGTYGAVIKLDGNGFTFKNFVINGTQFFDTLVSRNGEVSSIYNAGFIGTVSDDNGLFGKNVSASFDNCYFEISVASGKTNALTSTFASSMQGITNSIVIVKGAAGQTTTLGALSGDNIPATGSTIFIDSTSIVTAGGLLLDYTDNNIYVGSVDGQDVEIPLINPVKVFVGGKLINVQNTANGFILPSEYSIRGTNVIVVGSNYAKIVTLSRPTEEYFDVVAYASYATELGDIVTKDFAIDIEGTIKSVTIEGKSVSYELYDTFISIPSDVLKANTGKKLILVETDIKDYRVNATIADFGVSRASDISTFTGGVVTLSPVLRALGATSANYKETGANAKGYVALLNDIDFEGEAFTLGYSAYNSLGGNGNKAYYGFNGTFDGVGHSIMNFTFGGFSAWNTVFGVCSSTREFKDLTLIGTALSRYNEGLFGYFAMGNLTNCYFDITNAGTGYGVFGSAICGMKINNSTIIIRASEELDMTQPAIASSINKTTSSGTSLGRNMTVTNSTLITDFAVINDIKNAFGAVYGLNSNLLEIEANSSNEIIINLSGITKILKGGKDITAQASITETDAVLTTKVVKFGETIIIIGSNFAKIATIVKQAIVIEDYVTWATQTDDSGEIVGNSLIYKVKGEVGMVTIDDEQVDYSQVGDSVVVSSKVLSTYVGNREIYISTTEEAYRIKATIATFGITKLSDVCAPTHVLAPWRVAGGATSNNFKESGCQSGGYIVLTKDLVGTGTEMFHDGTIGTSQIGAAGNNAAYGFSGTFDGCGYSITNVVMGRSNAWVSGFGLTRSSAVIKNLKLQAITQGGTFQGVFNEYATGTIENCTFDLIINAGSRVFGAYIAGLTVKDSTIIIRTGTVTLSDALALNGVHTDGNQGSSAGLGASFTNTILYTDYPVREEYASYGLITKSISQIPVK